MTRLVLALTIGIALLYIGGPRRADVISPGMLTTHHAELLDCGGCHLSFRAGPTNWLHAAFVETRETDDSRLCLECHVRGDYAFTAHSQNPLTLAAMQKRARPPTATGTEPIVVALAANLAGSRRNTDSLSCADCHREHNGQKANLKGMSNARCQACHTAKFASLATGHPEFDRYPYIRRTRIVFDHISHIAKYFKDDKFSRSAPAQCTTCHQPDATGDTMLVAGFEKTCGGCHAREMESAGQAAPVITVPGFDVQTLGAKGVAIGEWPEDADAELNPFTILLLSGDPGFMAAWQAVKELSLMDDLAGASQTQLRAVQTIAWSVKNLMLELSQKGGSGLRSRLEKVLGRAISNQELYRLAGRLPVDLVRNAERAWFPNLDAEMERHRSGKRVPMPAPRPPDKTVPPAGRPAPAAGGKDTGDILAGGDTGDILAGGKDTGDILAGGDGGATSPSRSSPGQGRKIADAAPNYEWTAAGGWYRDQFSLMYRPAGHADDFFRAWLEASGAAESGPGRQLFTALAAPQAPGKCVKCHSIDAAGSRAIAINWRGVKPIKGHRRFTRFSHATHSKLLTEKGCLACHTPDPESDYLAGFKTRDPHTSVSNFRPMKKESCARCHVANFAEQSCVLCHNYHVGTFPPALVTTPMTIRAIVDRPRP